MALATGQRLVAAAHPAAPRVCPPGAIEETLLRQTDSSESLSSPNDLSGERTKSSSTSAAEVELPNNYQQSTSWKQVVSRNQSAPLLLVAGAVQEDTEYWYSNQRNRDGQDLQVDSATLGLKSEHVPNGQSSTIAQ